MGCQQHIPHFQQGMIGRDRLLPEYVNGSPLNGSVFQCIHQVLLVDHGGASRVDEIRRGLHFFKPALVHDCLCAGQNRQVNAHNITAAQHLLQTDRLNTGLQHGAFGAVGVIGQHFHAKCLCPGSDLSADGAEARNAEGLAVQLKADAIIRKGVVGIQGSPDHVPHIGYLINVLHRRAQMLSPEKSRAADANMSGHGDHHANGILRHRHGVSSGGVGQRDPQIPQGVKGHGNGRTLGNAQKLHAGCRPGLQGLGAGRLVSQHHQFLAHAFLPQSLLRGVSLAVQQFTGLGDIAVLFDFFQLFLRDSGAEHHFLLFHRYNPPELLFLFP